MLHVLSIIATILGSLGVVLLLACAWVEAMARRKQEKKPPATRWRGEDSHVN